MKKWMAIWLVCVLLAGTLAACNTPGQEEQTSTDALTEAPDASTPDVATEEDTQKGEDTQIEEDTEPEVPVATVTAPVFSVLGGLYAKSQKLEITAPAGTDYTVRYTTDGSVPTKKSKVFEDSISVPGFSVTTVRVEYDGICDECKAALEAENTARVEAC